MCGTQSRHEIEIECQWIPLTSRSSSSIIVSMCMLRMLGWICGTVGRGTILRPTRPCDSHPVLHGIHVLAPCQTGGVRTYVEAPLANSTCSGAICVRVRVPATQWQNHVPPWTTSDCGVASRKIFRLEAASASSVEKQAIRTIRPVQTCTYLRWRTCRLRLCE